MTKALGYVMVVLLSSGTVLADDAKAKKDQPAPADTKPAEPKPAPPPKEPAAGGASAEVKAGTGVEKHEIVGEATSFAKDTTVWVWSRIVNGEGSVKHVWKRDGKDVWTATLPVGSKRWATSSRRLLRATGSWEVDVQTADGASLGSVSFTIN